MIISSTIFILMKTPSQIKGHKRVKKFLLLQINQPKRTKTIKSSLLSQRNILIIINIKKQVNQQKNQFRMTGNLLKPFLKGRTFLKCWTIIWKPKWTRGWIFMKNRYFMKISTSKRMFKTLITCDRKNKKMKKLKNQSPPRKKLEK